ncbi:hypothetical protein [Bacillus thuringiensis]|uniref:hypothetical protein n=1 Tax=Bacillus thuringiensis TaxID=1428 RepID=UPI001594A410|nr:hypothetical protein [Bacillus thuringiensis]
MICNVDFYLDIHGGKQKKKYLVDECNLVKKRTIKLTETEELCVFDILDVVGKNYGNEN